MSFGDGAQDGRAVHARAAADVEHSTRWVLGHGRLQPAGDERRRRQRHLGDVGGLVLEIAPALARRRLQQRGELGVGADLVAEHRPVMGDQHRIAGGDGP